jgi:4-diphosphocytidyl-2-C-methyl-D-erythritol kinase
MPRLTARAHAKINWTLEVIGKRPDGYHEIVSVMSTVSLWDRVTLFPDTTWRFVVSAPHPLREEIEHPRNLVPRAIATYTAELARQCDGVPSPEEWPPGQVGPPFYVLLSKRIPAAAGLGGGSTDAAAALLLMRRAWRSEGLLDREALIRLAASLGSDVPFFLVGGTALAQGRGERLTPVGQPAEQWLVLLTPPIHITQKTARLYGLLRSEHFSDGSRSEALAQRLRAIDAPVIDDSEIVNTFDAVANDAFPGLDAARMVVQDVVGSAPHLCGAGPSLFALCESREAARWAAARLRAHGHTAVAVRPIVPQGRVKLPRT